MQTEIIEGANKIMELAQHETTNHALSRRRRWRKLQVSGLLQEYGRAEVKQVEADDHERKLVLTNESFCARSHEFSGGWDKLEEITTSGFSSPSPAAFDLSMFSQYAIRNWGGEHQKLLHAHSMTSSLLWCNPRCTYLNLVGKFRLGLCGNGGGRQVDRQTGKQAGNVAHGQGSLTDRLTGWLTSGVPE